MDVLEPIDRLLDLVHNAKRQTQLVAEHHLTGEAELESEEIIDDARADEREIRLGRRGLRRRDPEHLKINLSKVIAAIQRGRERLRSPDEPAELD